jgi:hypothetical protein
MAESSSWRVARTAAAILVLSGVGFLGWAWGSSGSPARPAVAASPGVPAAETPQISDPGQQPLPAAGTGRDALTPTEIGTARRLAVDSDLRATTADVTGAPGPEILSVSLPGAQGADAPRRAAVLLYDYRTDRLLKRVVNLTAGTVDNTFSAAGRQPPPVAREIDTAAGLVWNDAAGSVLRARSQAATGTELTSLGQLTIDAQSFTAAEGPCARHRCLMLLPQPAGHPYLDLTDLVVDLSARTVIRL